MSQDALERFLGRLITDDDFREYAMNSLPRVCFEHGFDLSAEEQKIIKDIDLEKFAIVSESLDKRIKRSRSLMRAYRIAD